MILTAYQPSYLPWIGLFKRIQQADVFVSCDTDELRRKDFLTRNRVQTDNGTLWLSVPVLGSRDQRICDVLIDNTKPWRRKHWGTIRNCYAMYHWFDVYGDELEEVYEAEWVRLRDLNEALLWKMMRWFELDTPFVRASERDFQGRGSDFILDMCRQMGASKYLCGDQGRNYLDLEAFDQAGVEVEFVEFPHDENTPSAIHQLFTEGPTL